MLNWRFAREVGFHRYVARNIVRQFHKRVLRADLRATMPTGMDYLVPTWSPGASEVYVRGGHIDQGLERVLFALLPQDAVLVDIGAHVGVYGAYCAPKLKHYIAVEPSTQCWPYIGKTLPEIVQVTLVRGFCGAVPGKARGEHDRRNGGVYPAAGPGDDPGGDGRQPVPLRGGRHQDRRGRYGLRGAPWSTRSCGTLQTGGYSSNTQGSRRRSWPHSRQRIAWR